MFRSELSFHHIRERRINPLKKVKGPQGLGQALRLTGEIKLQMGANKSAKEDLKLSFELQKRIRKEAICVHLPGSRLGQADVLWSLADCHFTDGNFQTAQQLINNCLAAYEDLQSAIGQVRFIKLDQSDELRLHGQQYRLNDHMMNHAKTSMRQNSDLSAAAPTSFKIDAEHYDVTSCETRH